MFPEFHQAFRVVPATRISRLTSKIVTLVTLLTFCLAANGAAQGPAGPDADFRLVPADHPLLYDTNLGLVERATNEAVEEALAGLRLEPGSKIRLHALTTHEASWFVEDVIARFLSDRGYQVHLVPKEKKQAKAASPAAEDATAADSNGSGSSTLAEAMAQSRGTGPNDADSEAGDDEAAANPSSDDDASEAGDPGDGASEAGTAQPPAGPNGPKKQAGPLTPPKPEEPDPSEVIPIPEGEGMVLTFRLIQFGVTYHDSWRRGFMGPRVVERLASVNLFTRLVSGSAENVHWVGQGKSEKLDIVPQSKIDLLEGMSYPFRKPEIRQKPLSRFLEPVLVSGIIGGLVFLFYTNQN